MKCIQRPIRGILTLSYLMIIIVTLLTPKNICQNINFSILDVNSTNMFTSTEIDVLIQDQLSSYNMTFSIKSNKYTTTFEGLDHLNTVFSDSNVDVIIATSPYEFINILSDFANQYDKLLVVNNNNFPLLDDSRTMFMHSGFKLVSSAMTEFLEWFQWANIAVIVTEEAYWQHMAVSLENDLLKNGFRIKHSKKISNFTDPSLFSHLLNDITADEKAIILAMEHTDIGLILPEINKWNEMDKHSFFLLSRDPYRSIDYITSTFINLPNVSRVLESVFVILPIVPNVFLTEIPSTLNESYSDISSIIAQGYHQSFSSTGQQFDSDMVTQQIKSSIFVNKNRTTKFVCLEERCLDFGLYDYDSETHSFKFTRFLRNINNGIWSRTVLKDISWPGDNILYPDECFPDPTCHIDSGINIVTVIVSALGSVAIVVLLALLGVYLWKRHAERFMTKGPNKIVLQLTDVTFLHRKELKSAKTDLSSQRGVFVDKPDLVKGSEKANNRSMVSLHELSEFSEIGRYKGDTVYIKEISSKGFEMSGKMLSHLRTLREIRHENINPMYGVLIDPTCTAVVTEYCNRGSLQDVIKSDHIKLDWDFKISLLTDLVRGLRFLQNSPIRYHGNMKSANCVIDSRWVLKLTNFGLKEKIKVTVQLEPADLLWTAPEHLREQYPGSKGSEKGDMYSFAIISQELILRLSPFGMTELKPHEIIKKLTKPPPLLRPSVSPQAAPPQYIQLMKSCWAENPDMRPSIEEVYHQYKIISGGKKLNIVDSMFRMLEKYSNDLEDIVKERTMELEEEKKKTDLLLFRMLPATVAESLKIGRSIEAEMFTEVTIYFSDIVGFTTISAMSTPMQVVDLLNDLYTMFDATIDIYDVYKVETIGDAYMVASGLPLRNGNRHAGEIGTMALDLLSQCGTFKIRHMPEVPMRVRIGLHSGSCVAGVVGLTMPRYCLFGDTVNTASRMESTGAAFRIHISSQTKTRLDELGSYKTQYRGEVELKGKGMAKTYWLIGKEEFKKPLPEPPPIDSLDSVMQTNDENSVKTGDEPATSSIQQNNSNGPSKFRKQSKQNNMSHIVHQNGKEALQNGSVKDSLIKSDKNERLVRKLEKGESLDEQISLFCNAHDVASFKSSASDSSITTKASVISVDSVISSSDCELRVLKSPKTPIDENSSQLSPVSEV